MRRNKKYNGNTRVITLYNEENNTHIQVSKNLLAHNHDSDVLKSKVADVVNNIKHESVLHKPSQIINDCISTTSEEISAHIPTHKNLKQRKIEVKKRKTANQRA